MDVGSRRPSQHISSTEPPTASFRWLGVRLGDRRVIELVAVALLALLIRLPTLNDSLWLDELHTSWAVSGTLADVSSRAAAGNQGPVYFWSVWGLTQLFGHSEVVLRSFSVACGVGALLILSRIVLVSFASPVLSYLVLLLGAIDPHFVFYAREARPYALVQLLSVVHISLLLRLLQESTTLRRVAWVLVGTLMFYTHITSILLLAVECCMVLFATCRSSRRNVASNENRSVLIAWAANFAVLLAACAAFLPQMMFVFQRRDNWSYFIKPDTLGALWRLFPANVYVAQPFFVAIILAIAMRWLGARSGTRSAAVSESAEVADDMTPDAAAQRERAAIGGIYSVFGFCLPLLLTWLTTRFEIAPLFHRRYTWVAASSLLALPAVIGHRIVPLNSRRWYTLAVVLLALQYFASYPMTRWTQHSSEDWRSMASWLNSEVVDGPVLLRSGLIEDDALNGTAPDVLESNLAAYCRFPLEGLYGTQRIRNMLVPIPSHRPIVRDDLPALLLRHKTAWLVSRGSREKADRCFASIRLALAGQFHAETLQEREFDGLIVYRLQLVPSAAQP